MKKWLPLWMAAGVLFAAFPLRAQQGGQRAAAAEEKPEEGIPVTDPLVISKCGVCHKPDAKGNLSRISWERATPEGWEEAIKRMMRLNGLKLTPEETKSVLKYLSSSHGLAPEEAKPIMYMAEHRMVDENIPNEQVKGTCTACHAIGRGLQWRRAKEDWKLLANLHVFLFPQAEGAFMNGGYGRGLPPGRDPKAPPVIDSVLDYLAKNDGLHSPEWAAWQARMRSAKMEGRWLVTAYLPGKGKYVGDMVVDPASAADEFTTKVTLHSVKDGSTIQRTGRGLMYAGYSWRGRSKGAAAGSAPDDVNSEMREAMWVAPDQSYGEGRWFWGNYQEFGFDVRIERASADPTLLSLDRTMLKVGSTAQRVKLLGNSFPADLNAAALDFGSGIKVRNVVSHTATEIVAEVDVDAKAVSGKRDVSVRRSILPNALAVYDRIDYIKVTPESALSRLGGDVHPKGYQQFEAIAYQRGADGEAHTADDVELGPIDVNWSMEEFLAVYGDDDREFIGSLNATGFFTPSLDGPNPQRKFSRNNYGDVWVVATAKNEKDQDGNPLVGKGYLVVTVPMYVRYDQPEVGQ